MKPCCPRGLSALSALGLACLLLSSCLTPEAAVAEVDAEAYEAIGDAQEIQFGSRFPFTIDPIQNRVMAEVIDPETGLVRPGASLVLDLATILDVAAINSREFQQQKQSLYTTAIAMLSERQNFNEQPFGIFGGAVRDNQNTGTVDASGQLGVTRMLERGGQVALAIGLDFLRFVSSPTSNSLNSLANLTISLPFLRNAGLEIVSENLIQAERDLIYSLRTFERFKQTFTVQVISDYLGVLTLQQRIRNEQANLKSLERAAYEAEQRFAEGRVRILEVEQNQQAVLRGETSLVRAVQTFESSLDRLKNLVGIPVDIPVELRPEDLEDLDALIAETLDIDEPRAMTLALRNRLDFRNAVDIVDDRGRKVKVAENQLLPDFTLNLAADVVSKDVKPLRYNYKDGTYSAAFDMDLALNRVLESYRLRQSLINLQISLQNQEDAREGVKLEVRNAVRVLARAQDEYRIAKNAVALARKRVVSTRELQAVGRAITRDFLEAQDSLLANENTLVEAKVAYRIAFLALFRDTGALVVDPGGLDYELSRALLVEP